MRRHGVGVAAVVVVGAVSAFVAGCGSDGAHESGAAALSGGAGPDAFCVVYTGLPAEVPESYVGSAQHVAAIAALASAAPAELQPGLERVRQFLASGAVTPGDADSKLSDDWPADVRQAIEATQAYGASRC
jgi:hypothetical protein